MKRKSYNDANMKHEFKLYTIYTTISLQITLFFASRRMACVSRMWKRARTFTHVKWCVMRTQAKTWYWLGITLAHRIGGRKWWKKAHRKYTQWKMLCVVSCRYTDCSPSFSVIFCSPVSGTTHIKQQARDIDSDIHFAFTPIFRDKNILFLFSVSLAFGTHTDKATIQRSGICIHYACADEPMERNRYLMRCWDWHEPGSEIV